jgi:phosphohistidine phosphatase
MKTLCLMRHSEAAENLQLLGLQKDFDRPLTDNGIALLDQCRVFFKEQHFLPDLVLCSSAVRTQQTLEWIRDSLRNKTNVVYDEALYKATTDHIIERLANLPSSDASVLIIGHNPWISELSQLLLNATPNPLAINLPAPPAFSGIFEIHIEEWSKFKIGANSVHLKNYIIPN